MNYKEAREAIWEILASIPDHELPNFSKVEIENGKPIAWLHGQGWHLGSGLKNGERDPSIYRGHGIDGAIEAEAVYRADKVLFDNGDKLEGLNLKSQGLEL